MSFNLLSAIRRLSPSLFRGAIPQVASNSALTTGATARTKSVSPDYGKLFKDGFLPITVGIGFDESNADARERRQVLRGLRSRGFESIDVKGLTADELRERGIDPALVDREGTYFVKKFEHEGKPVTALLKYIDRETPAAADRFRQGFVNRGLIIYGGHARYGSGPDFDVKESPAGNFVIGAPYSAEMARIIQDNPNELRQNLMTDDYQLMFFSACTSLNYLDELRSLPTNRATQDLDFIGSNADLYWPEMAENVLTVIDSVLSGGDADTLKASLVQLNRGVDFTFDGFDDNAGPAPV